MLTLVIAASLGQYGVAGGYVAAQHQQQQYCPQHQQHHATVTYGAVNHANVGIAAPHYDPHVNVALVGDYLRKELADAEATRLAAAALKAQTDLTSRVDQLNQSVGQLTIRFGQALAQPDPAPQQPYGVPAPPLASPQTPAYSTPPVPGKNYPAYGTQAPTEPPVQTAEAALIGPVFARNGCMGCHSGPGAAAGISLDNPDALDLATRDAVWQSVKSNRMPDAKSKRPPLSNPDKLLVKAWVKDSVN